MIACRTVFAMYLYTHTGPIYRMEPRCVRVVFWVAQTSEFMGLGKRKRFGRTEEFWAEIQECELCAKVCQYIYRIQQRTRAIYSSFDYIKRIPAIVGWSLPHCHTRYLKPLIQSKTLLSIWICFYAPFFDGSVCNCRTDRSVRFFDLQVRRSRYCLVTTNCYR